MGPIRGSQGELGKLDIVRRLRFRGTQIGAEAVFVGAIVTDYVIAVFDLRWRAVLAAMLMACVSAHGHDARLPGHGQPYSGDRRHQPANPGFLPAANGGEQVHRLEVPPTQSSPIAGTAQFFAARRIGRFGVSGSVQSSLARSWATMFNIFSVAITAAAVWSVSTPTVENRRPLLLSLHWISVSTRASVRPPGGMRTR